MATAKQKSYKNRVQLEKINSFQCVRTKKTAPSQTSTLGSRQRRWLLWWIRRRSNPRYRVWMWDVEWLPMWENSGGWSASRTGNIKQMIMWIAVIRLVGYKKLLLATVRRLQDRLSGQLGWRLTQRWKNWLSNVKRWNGHSMQDLPAQHRSWQTPVASLYFCLSICSPRRVNEWFFYINV